jgi:hypothetical protein
MRCQAPRVLNILAWSSATAARAYSSNTAAGVSTQVAFAASKVRTDAVGVPFGMNKISFTDGATVFYCTDGAAVFYCVWHAVCRPRKERGNVPHRSESKHLQEICFCPQMALVNNCGWVAKDDSKIRQNGGKN